MLVGTAGEDARQTAGEGAGATVKRSGATVDEQI